MPTWGGSTLEFPVYGPPGQVSAVAINVTGTQSMLAGFVTAFPAGVTRPTASNLNVDTWDQTIANHAIVRASNRGVSLFTQSGLHLIADLNGWYLGPPTTAVLAPPVNPFYGPATAREVDAPLHRHVHSGRYREPTSTPWPTLALPPRGMAQPSWRRLGTSCCSGIAPPTVRRCSTSTSFRSAAPSRLIGDDGHSYNYIVVRQDVTVPSFTLINNIGLKSGIATVQLVACTPPHSVTFRWVTTARLVSVT